MARNRIQGITIEIEGNTTKLQSALKGVNSHLQQTQSALKDVDRLLKVNPGNVELLQQKQKLLAEAVSDTSEKLKTEKQALEQLKNGPQTEETIRQQEALTREIIDTENQLSSLKKEYKDFGSVAEQQAKVAADKMKKVGEEISKVGDNMSKVGSGLTKGVTAPITAVGGVAVASAVDFEDAMAKVSTIADDTEVSLGDMQSAIMELSDQTGISASEIADNVYNAISAGQKTGDAVSFVKNATMLAKAGFTDSASALDILTTTMNAYGMEASDVTRVSDVLIQTQNLGKTTVGELASAMGKVIPTAKSNGVQLETLAGAYAVMTANGIATAETTTYLNSMLNELGKQGTTAADAFAAGTEHIKEGGLTMAEAMEMGWDLTDVLSILDEQAAESGTTIQNMFSSAEAGKAANVLWDNGAKLNDVIDQMGAAAGSTQTAFDKLDTTSFQTQITLNQLKNTGIEIGTTLLEMLQPALEMVSDAVSKLKGWWDGLDESQQQMVVKCAMLAAAAGPVLTIAGKGVSLAGSLVSAGSGLLTTFAGIGSKLGGLAQGAGNAVNSVSSLGSAASSAAAPVSSAGGAVGSLSQNALGLVAAGAGILLASAGLALLAQAAIQIADAGPGAAVAMVGLVAAIAAMAAGAAALAPALAAGSAGLIAFGAGVALVGVGILAATGGLALLATQLPTIATYGTSAAVAIVQIGGSMVVLSAGALAAAAAMTAMLLPFAGAALTIGATDVALLGLSVTLGTSTVAAAALGVALLAVSAPVESIRDNAVTAGDALSDMVSSVNVVNAALDGFKDKLGDAAEWFSGIFTQETPKASAAAMTMTEAAMNSMLISTTAGLLAINTAWVTNIDRLSTIARTQMYTVENTIQASLNRIQQMFANTQFRFNQNIVLPHFSLSGEFNPESGSVPSVSVSWYRKAYDDAYILNGATIFGAMGGRYLGGGEGGSEMVVGTERMMQMIRNAVGPRELVQNVNIYSPKEVSASEAARQLKNANRQMVLSLRGKG